TLDPLPTQSNNGISGSWSPALDNTVSTTYTFTPNTGECAASTTLFIEVEPNVVPTFNQVPAICVGENLTELPTTSLNGIVGTWSPALNNTVTTTYTFTPDNSCATSATLEIVVNPLQFPEFDAVAPICEGDALAPLPITSNDGITGSWSPALNNLATTTYTFTPGPGQDCAQEVTLEIVVNPLIDPLFDSIDPICEGDTLDPLPTQSNNGISGSWSPALDNTVSTT
ncbi:gliding motility-associated C-terminal domain-containing protein, partial [Winogradskyella sp. DF17]|nr:gliding motility-associated C-terminal domain-containing protein [Winogradskyella sp. DF17]